MKENRDGFLGVRPVALFFMCSSTKCHMVRVKQDREVFMKFTFKR